MPSKKKSTKKVAKKKAAPKRAKKAPSAAPVAAGVQHLIDGGAEPFVGGKKKKAANPAPACPHCDKGISRRGNQHALESGGTIPCVAMASS
jgi:hypothetical protein